MRPCLGSFHLLGHFLGEDKFWAKILKTDNFVSLIAPQKQPLQNNYCIPWRSQRKMLRDENNQKFWGCFLGVVICLTKSVFFWFFEKCQNRRICVANFSMKTAPTEKMEHAMTKPTENATKLSIQKFDFQNFVTEIFQFKICYFWYFFDFQIFIKMTNFKFKNLCDKVFKIKNLNWQFCCIFRWLRRGILLFICRRYLHGEICNTKLPILRFSKKSKKRWLCETNYDH